jgi:catechol O-methyltransferase
VLKNVVLILVSLIFLPLSTAILLLSYAVRTLLPAQAAGAAALRNRRQACAAPAFRPKTVLVTGVGMAKGLSLARAFYAAGHSVVGADFEPDGVPVSGRMSCALRKFYCLSAPGEPQDKESMGVNENGYAVGSKGKRESTAEAGAKAEARAEAAATAEAEEEGEGVEDGTTRYIQELLAIIRRERVDLWVSCSGVASAVQDAQAAEAVERRTRCRAVQLNAHLTRTLHEKHSFIEHTASLGLTVPETHLVTSRAAVHKILNRAAAPQLLPLSPSSSSSSPSPPGKRFILKNVGVDDASRGDMTLLPRPTRSETYNHVSALHISPANPWVLQEFVGSDGASETREYCSHALVVRGEVRAFVACPSSDLLMHYRPLPPGSALSRAMLRFTQHFASAGLGRRATGHVSFDFIAVERVAAAGSIETLLYPIECNPRAHTAVVLFGSGGGGDDGDASRRMVDAYLSALDSDANDDGVHTDHGAVRGSGSGGMSNGYDEHKHRHQSHQSLHQQPNGDTGHDAAAVVVTPPTHPVPAYYWAGHDVVALCLLPLLQLLGACVTVISDNIRIRRGFGRRNASTSSSPTSLSTSVSTSSPKSSTSSSQLSQPLADVLRGLRDLTAHVLLWREGTYAPWDPLPAWWLYHAYWPGKFAVTLARRRPWSRVNVSTTKIFGC